MASDQPTPSVKIAATLGVPLYVALFFFLFAVYLLTYTPRINSSDGLAMFATAESIARRGALDIEQIRWMDLQQGTYALDGLLYSRKGIGVPIGLLPLTWPGLIIPRIGPVSASLLFNAVVTALSAVVLIAYLAELGFARRIGLFVALAFGLTTLAWPYAKSLFSDPFSGLLLLVAAYCLLKISRGAGKPGSRGEKKIAPVPPGPLAPLLFYPFLAGLFLGWNVATRYAEALFLPVYGLLLLYYLFAVYRLQFTTPALHAGASVYNLKKFILHAPRSSFIIRPIAAFIAPILLIGLALIAFNISRYGNPLNTGYLPNETFSAIWLDGIIGQLFSPGRGLLLFSPVLLLSLWGFSPFFRRFRAEALLALSIILIHLLLYGKWFMWHGGYAWGPRFMIPTLPFWALFLAPVVEHVFPAAGKTRLSTGRWALRVAFLALMVMGVVVQVQAVTIDFAPFLNSLLNTGLPLFARETFFKWAYSPLISAWNFISMQSLDLAWAWQGQVNWGLLAALLVNVVITAIYLAIEAANLRGSEAASGELAADQASSAAHRIGKAIPYPLSYFSTAIALFLLLNHSHGLPAPPVQLTVADLNQNLSATDGVITNGPEITLPFSEMYKGHAPVLGLNNGGFPLPDDIVRRLNKTRAAHAQIWWIPNWLPPQESGIEQALAAEMVKVRDEDFGGQRLVLFAAPPAPANAMPVEANFGQKITLTTITFAPESLAGTALTLEFQWRAIEPIPDDYRVFIHLLDARGQLVAQTDGQPVRWTRPTSNWTVGESIIDRHGLWIPAEATPGSYQLRVGLYQPANGKRLHLPDGADSLHFPVTVIYNSAASRKLTINN